MVSIDDLIMLMKGGVLTPQDALGTYQSQEQARRERRIDRKQAMAEAQGDALDSLSSTALKAAGEPTDLQGVMRAFGAEQAFASGDPQSALDQLFLPEEGRNRGMSRIDPTLPGDAAADIERIVQAEYQGGNEDPATIRRAVAGALGYGPKTLGRLSSEIETIVNAALKRVRGSA